MAFLPDRPSFVPKGRRCHGDRQAHLTTKDPADVPGLAPGPHRDQKMAKEATLFEKDSQHGFLRQAFDTNVTPVKGLQCHLTTKDPAEVPGLAPSQAGLHRDQKMSKEADAFEQDSRHGFLRQAFDTNVAPVNRCVRTYHNGDHDVLNSTESVSLTPRGTQPIVPKRQRSRLDEELEKLHHQQDVLEADRVKDINKFSSSPGLVQKLSPQPLERVHKAPTETPHGKHQCPSGVEGFSKMGTTTNEEPLGRHCSKREYDPKRLAFPLWGEQEAEPIVVVHGLSNVTNAKIHQNRAANRNDRSSPPDIPGFAGVKSHDPPMGRHHPTTEQYTDADPLIRTQESKQPPPPPTHHLARHQPYTHGGGAGGDSPQIFEGFQGMGSVDAHNHKVRHDLPVNQGGLKTGHPQHQPSGPYAYQTLGPCSVAKGVVSARRTNTNMLP